MTPYEIVQRECAELRKRFDELVVSSNERAQADQKTIDALWKMLAVQAGEGIVPPTHLTLIQTARYLGVPKSTVHFNMEPGRKLEAELWNGVRMVPTWRAMAFRKRFV